MGNCRGVGVLRLTEGGSHLFYLYLLSLLFLFDGGCGFLFLCLLVGVETIPDRVEEGLLGTNLEPGGLLLAQELEFGEFIFQLLGNELTLHHVGVDRDEVGLDRVDGGPEELTTVDLAGAVLALDSDAAHILETALVAVGLGETAGLELIHNDVEELGNLGLVLGEDQGLASSVDVGGDLCQNVKGGRLLARSPRIANESDALLGVGKTKLLGRRDPVLSRGKTLGSLGTGLLMSNELLPDLRGDHLAVVQVETLDVSNALVDTGDGEGEADGTVGPLLGSHLVAVNAADTNLTFNDSEGGWRANSNVLLGGAESDDVLTQEAAEGAERSLVLRNGQRDLSHEELGAAVDAVVITGLLLDVSGSERAH